MRDFRHCEEPDGRQSDEAISAPSYPASLSSYRPRPRRKAMGEIAVKRQRLRDAELLHHHEAQTIDHAVFLVGISLEILERIALFLNDTR